MNQALADLERPLQAIFADEACLHLAHIDASLAALGEHAAPQAALLLSIQDALHTLKGAARAIGLGELEYLCHAMEQVFAAAAAARVTLTPAQLARLRSAIGVAATLVAPPTGRSRNQALALIGQLDALARELAAAPPRP